MSSAPSLFTLVLQRPELLLPIQGEPDRELFVDAMRIAFDLTEEVMVDIRERDLLWTPRPSGGDGAGAGADGGKLDNYFTLASADTREREPIPSILSYLFERREPYYMDKYSRDAGETERLKTCIDGLRARYATADAYFGDVARRLFLPRAECVAAALSDSGARRARLAWTQGPTTTASPAPLVSSAPAEADQPPGIRAPAGQADKV